MRPTDAMTFRGAVKILGQHDRPVLNKVNHLLGGTILVSGAAAAVAAIAGSPVAPLVAFAALWGWVDQKNQAVESIRTLLNAVADRRRGVAGRERLVLIEAAHTILVISSVMDAVRDALDVKSLAELDFTEDEQRYLAVGHETLDHIYTAEVPLPSVGCGFKENIELVADHQSVVLERVLGFLSGLSAVRHIRMNSKHLGKAANNRYTSRFHELAARVPEFMVWSFLGEHAATRNLERVHQRELCDALTQQSVALSRLESLLVATLTQHGDGLGRNLVEIIQKGSVAELERPVVSYGSSEPLHRTGIRFPLVREIYLEPDYRITRFGAGRTISSERWWSQQVVYDDLDVRLVAHLSSPTATRQPLLILGHPGSGKSMLTKVLAARLPAASFVGVHVPLRHVEADAPIYVQVQQALDRQTNGRVNWHELAESSQDTIRVVLLDGLDELLQAAEHNRSSFLHEVADFQRREAEQERPVAVIVTTRTVVAERVGVLDGTTVIKLEDFHSDQVEQWRNVWNQVNAPGTETGDVRALTHEAVIASGEIARQPLLLLMIALYSADPSTPPMEKGVSQTILYRRLLENFAEREAGKSVKANHDILDEFVRQLLRSLSVAALAMFNRGRQNVSDVELGKDLTALDVIEDNRPENAGRGLAGQFFFIHTAQTQSGENTQRSYEFLHATFGEYLVAREVVEVLQETSVDARSRRRSRGVDDDLLFALLSHQVFATRRSVLIFLTEMVRDLPKQDLESVEEALKLLLLECRSRHSTDRYATYRPTEVDHVRELAVYSANLFLLWAIMRYEGADLSKLWPETFDLTQWRSTVHLWQAGLDANSWLALLVTIKQGDGKLSIVGTDEPLHSNFDVLHADLIGDRRLSDTLQMGIAIRQHNEFFPIQQLKDGYEDLRERLGRWLVPRLVFVRGTTSPDLTLNLVSDLLRRCGPQLAGLRPLIKAALERQTGLSGDDLRAVVAGVMLQDDIAQSIFHAACREPSLLEALPALHEPERYLGENGIEAVRIMHRRLQDRRQGRTEHPEIARLHDAIENAWRRHMQRTSEDQAEQ